MWHVATLSSAQIFLKDYDGQSETNTLFPLSLFSHWSSLSLPFDLLAAAELQHAPDAGEDTSPKIRRLKF